MRTRGAALVRADALRIPLADESVDLIVTSPPYFALRSYQDDGQHYAGQMGSESDARGFLAALWAVMDECHRVLKPTGSAFIDLGDKYAGSGGGNQSGVLAHRNPAHTAVHEHRNAMDAPRRYNQSTDVPVKSLMGLPWRFALGLTCPDDYRNDGVADVPQWTLRAEIVWSKPNGLPESVTDRVRRSHEQFFHFTKQGRYYAAVDEVREAHQFPNQSRTKGRSMNGGLSSNSDPELLNPLGKLPGSVWTIPSEPLSVPEHLGVDHFAAFPQEWPRRLILGWSPSGICVKCGDGRAPVVELGRTAAFGNLGNGGKRDAASDHGQRNATGHFSHETERFNRTATITGYACRCDVPIAATRPSVILDPFVGTGTVPMVARMLGRYGIGLDLSADYLRLATWRVFQSGHGRKTMSRTDRERQGALW